MFAHSMSVHSRSSPDPKQNSRHPRRSGFHSPLVVAFLWPLFALVLLLCLLCGCGSGAATGPASPYAQFAAIRALPKGGVGSLPIAGEPGGGSARVAAGLSSICLGIVR
jgi:hypothetical protein